MGLCYGKGFLFSWQGQSYKQILKSKEMEEIFARTLEVVSDTADISPELILSKDRHEDVFDARCLFVYLLHLQGMYPVIISRRSGFCIRSVNYCISRFNDRMKSRNYLRTIFASSAKQLGINSLTGK